MIKLLIIFQQYYPIVELLGRHYISKLQHYAIMFPLFSYVLPQLTAFLSCELDSECDIKVVKPLIHQFLQEVIELWSVTLIREQWTSLRFLVSSQGQLGPTIFLASFLKTIYTFIKAITSISRSSQGSKQRGQISKAQFRSFIIQI